MIRALLASLLFLLPTPALAFGVPLCAPAEMVMERKVATGWDMLPLAVAEQGATAYLALGPTGEVEVFTVSGGLACLVFGGTKAVAPAAEPVVPPREG